MYWSGVQSTGAEMRKYFTEMCVSSWYWWTRGEGATLELRDGKICSLRYGNEVAQRSIMTYNYRLAEARLVHLVEDFVALRPTA